MDRIIGLLQRPGADGQVVDDGTPWYIKYGSRILGIVGAFFCVLFGLWNCLGILVANVSCLIGGILQIILGFLVMAVEAPFCCMFIDHVQQLAAKVEQRPLWNRAVVYCVLALPPVFLCFGLGSIFGCGLVFGTGVLYGMMGLGKKASLEDMRSAAAQQQQSSNNTKGGLFSNLSSANVLRSNLVNNAQPMGTSQAPGFDSNV